MASEMVVQGEEEGKCKRVCERSSDGKYYLNVDRGQRERGGRALWDRGPGKLSRERVATTESRR